MTRIAAASDAGAKRRHEGEARSRFSARSRNVIGAAERRDRVGHAPPEEVRVADDRVESESRGEQNEVIEPDQGACSPDTRCFSRVSQSRAAGSEGPPQTVSLSGSTIRLSGG